MFFLLIVDFLCDDSVHLLWLWCIVKMIVMMIRCVLWCSDLAAQDSDGCTALMLAAQNGHCAVVETLLRHSEAVPGQCQALVNVPNKLGQTALHEAAKRGHVAIAAALIFAGALVDAPDRWNNRPLHYAALHGHTTIVAMLATRPALDQNAAADTAVRHADVNATNQVMCSTWHHQIWTCIVLTEVKLTKMNNNHA